MRLESDFSSPSVVEGAVVDAAVSHFDREANDALREGVQAAQSGDRARARTALLRATELDPSSEAAWLWLASISEYPEELMVFLNNVLDINPYNGRALEWMAATKSLLAKTFVQRGVDAASGGQADLAAQCFNNALENDQSNGDAWLWLAKLSDSPEAKLSYLEKVVEIDPSNEEARAEYTAAKGSINAALLAEARAAAVSGRKGDANDLLDAFIVENPDSEDGWILRSHLADEFGDKIRAFERVLEINPSNPVALSGVESLRSIMSLVSTDEVRASFVPDHMENTATVIDSEKQYEAEVVHDKSPTQDLEFPEAAADLHERETGQSLPLEGQTETEAELAGTVENAPDWAMNTVSFSFAFPGGTQPEEPVATDVHDVDVAAHESFEFTAGGPRSEGEDDALYEASAYEPVPSPATLAEEFAPVPAPSGDLSLRMEQETRTEEVSVATDVTTTGDECAEAFVAHGEAIATDECVTAEEVDTAPEEVQEGSIPKPVEFSVEEVFAKTGFETTLASADSATAECPFCRSENPGQAFTCGHCLSTLTLSDLEMLLANSHADRSVLRNAVSEMQTLRESRELSEAELTQLGIALLNLRDLDAGLRCLQEASQLNPNNVVLSGQVNSLLIRIDEIRQQEASAEAKPKEKKILVVDDSATVRKLIAGKLEKCGHQVYTAADGIEAIEQLDTVVPDLILLDITMPRMDGYQVCKVVRGKDSTKDVPVVMISGKDGFFDKVRGRMAGTSGYITKPFGPETLMKAVETYLSGQVEIQ